MHLENMCTNLEILFYSYSLSLNWLSLNWYIYQTNKHCLNIRFKYVENRIRYWNDAERIRDTL
jgi:hypothetical protein